jgi:hypothetical protein
VTEEIQALANEMIIATDKEEFQSLADISFGLPCMMPARLFRCMAQAEHAHHCALIGHIILSIFYIFVYGLWC